MDCDRHSPQFTVARKMLTHGVSQGALTAAQGGKFQHGFFSAAFTAGLAPGIQKRANSNFGKVIASSIVGGTASVLGGGKFANGAITGAYVMLFNEMMHQKDGNTKGGDKTRQEQLEEKLQSMATGESMSGKELAKLLGESKISWGVDEVTRVSESKFEVKSTILGSRVIKSDAYIEMIPNQSISGQYFDRGNITRTGILIKTYGLPAVEVNNMKVTSFIVNKNYAFFRVNSTEISSWELKH